MDKRRIINLLMIGPLPPPLGGATISFEQLSLKLKSRDDFRIKIVPSWRAGRFSFLKKILFSFFTIFRVIIEIGRVDEIIFFASDRGTKMVAPLINLLSRISGKPWILRKFGGGFDHIYKESSVCGKFLIKNFILSANLCLFQTRYLVDFFKKISPESNIDWHANSRPIATLDNSSICVNKCSRFVFIGHLIASRGIDIIIEATKIIKDDITIDIYGPIIDEGFSKASIEGPKIRYRGYLTYNEVIPTLSKYDCLVFPTVDRREGYPGIILEAYSAGIPVITTNWRSIPEIVDNSCGILIESFNAEDLARAMSELSNDRELYYKLCKGTRNMIRQFSLDLWADKLAKYCVETLNNHKAIND